MEAKVHILVYAQRQKQLNNIEWIRKYITAISVRCSMQIITDDNWNRMAENLTYETICRGHLRALITYLKKISNKQERSEYRYRIRLPGGKT